MQRQAKKGREKDLRCANETVESEDLELIRSFFSMLVITKDKTFVLNLNSLSILKRRS